MHNHISCTETKDTTICSTQNAHREQHIQENTETEHTIQNTDTHAQPQHTCSTHNYRTYSFDFIV